MGCRGRAVGVVVLAVLAIAGCGDSDERSMCEAHAEYVTTLERLVSADVSEASVGDAATAIEDLDAEVAQLRAVADGHNEAMVDDLDQRLRDLVDTLTALDADVPFTAVQDLVADDIDAVRDAAARVADEFEPICNPPD